jgi:peptidoglycan/xylan/chitin deacetylase (PgdA/CDA1 family)
MVRGRASTCPLLPCPQPPSGPPNDVIVTLPEWAKQMRVMQVIDRTGWLETDDYVATRLPPPEKQKAKVSLTFDDGWVTAYAYLVNQMDKRGITGTHFIITEYMDKPGYTADYIGSKKVKELLGLGHEIGSHTLNHEDMSLATPEQLNENLELSKKRLENLGAKVVSFAWPYGYYTMPYAERAQQTYNLVRTVKAGINVPPYNTSELWGFVVTNTTTVAEIEEAVRQTEEIKDGWLILIYHRADEDPPNDAFVTPQSFVDTLDMLQKREADVRPMGAILGLWQPVPLPPEPTKVMQCCKAFDPPEVFTPSSKVDTQEDVPATDGCQSHRTADSGLAPLLVLLATGLGLLQRRKSRVV